MRLFYSPASPYVRKVMVLAHETGLADGIEHIDCAASPVARDQSIVAFNPTGKIPALILDNGTTLYDSRVICQYIDTLHTGKRMYPAEGPKRFDVLTREALADGLLDAALLARYETVMRPPEKLWPEWLQGQMDKIDSSLDRMEETVASRHDMDAGQIACACALGYLDFRFPDHDWRSSRPRLAEWFEGISKRASLDATMPQG